MSQLRDFGLILSISLPPQHPRCPNCPPLYKFFKFSLVKSSNFPFFVIVLVCCCFILGDPGAVSRVGRKGGTKVFKYGRKSPWVPTLTELFPKIQADAGSWLGTKNALYCCAQSANNFSWVLFVSSYTTAIVSITACVAHAPKKCTQPGNFHFDIWYSGALSPVLQNFRHALSPDPTDCPWVSEDGCCLR